MKFIRNSVLGILSISMLLGLSACGSKQPSSSSTKTQQTASNSNKQQQTQTDNSNQKQQSKSHSSQPNSNSGQSTSNSQPSQSQIQSSPSTGIKSGTKGTTAKNTLEHMTFAESSITLDLLHGNMQSIYQNPHIISSGNTQNFVVTLHNVTQGKFALNKKIPVSKSLVNYYILTKKGSDLVLTCNLNENVKKVQTGISGGFQISFNFVK